MQGRPAGRAGAARRRKYSAWRSPPPDDERKTGLPAQKNTGLPHPHRSPQRPSEAYRSSARNEQTARGSGTALPPEYSPDTRCSRTHFYQSFLTLPASQNPAARIITHSSWSAAFTPVLRL